MSDTMIHALSTVSYNTILRRIPPLTSDSYRSIMMATAAYLRPDLP